MQIKKSLDKFNIESSVQNAKFQDFLFFLHPSPPLVDLNIWLKHNEKHRRG